MHHFSFTFFKSTDRSRSSEVLIVKMSNVYSTSTDFLFICTFYLSEVITDLLHVVY